MKIPRCRGSRDLSPEEMMRFRLIERVFRDCCLKWGYQEVRTPTIEYLHLFTSAGTLTPSMLSRVYSFLDWDGWSGERVVLRPDGTIPIARLYIDSLGGKGLARLCYVSNIFIFEETGEKARERWQCGTELIGVGCPLADAELICLSQEILKTLGMKDVELRLSHAGLIRTLLVKLGLSAEEQTKIFDQILDGNAEALAGVTQDNPVIESALLPLLNLQGQSSGFLKNLKAISAKNLPDIKAPLNDFINTVDILEKLGCDYRIDIASGARYEYYTGMIFQLFCDGEKIGGGGRYDALIPAMDGKDIPASGFALYMDRLMNRVKPEAFGSRPPRIMISVKSSQISEMKAAYEVAGQLRASGYAAELELGGGEREGLKWILDVQDNDLPFILWDKVESEQYEAQTIGELLKILEEKGADKDSPA